MQPIPKRVRKRALTRAKKLAQLGQFSKKPAEVLREQCPTRIAIQFHVYHWDRRAYLPVSAASFRRVLIRNPREFARLRKHIEDYVMAGGYMDERNERAPEPPSVEKQLDPALHRNQPGPLDGD